MKIFDNQNKAANEIFKLFYNDNKKEVLLHAQMQQGKTGTYLSFIEKYLSAVHGEAHIVLSESNKDLIKQIRKDARNILSDEILSRTEICHRANLKKDLGTNVAVLVLDESHLAAGTDQKHGQTLKKILSKDKPPLPTLLVSATPVREVALGYFKDSRVILEETEEYYGIKKMFSDNRLMQSAPLFERGKKKINDVFKSQIDRLVGLEEKKYGIVRVSDEKQAEKLKEAVLKLHPNIHCDIRTNNKKNLNFDFFNNSPERPTIVILTGSMRVGKQLNTKHVTFVWETPFSNTDTAVQGLLGRCCGYGKRDHGVTIFCDIKQAKNYLDIVKSNFTEIKDGKTTNISVTSDFKHWKPVQTIDMVGKNLKVNIEFLKNRHGITTAIRNFSEYDKKDRRVLQLREHAKKRTPYGFGLDKETEFKGAVIDPELGVIYIMERSKNPVLVTETANKKEAFMDTRGKR